MKTIKVLYNKKPILIILLAILYIATSCSSTQHLSNSKIYQKKAVAVYYHDKYNGKPTASGEIFSNSKYTAAHKTLPFGTKLRVTNLKNNKSTQVKVNDRGPFSKGRDIDLSKKAFMELADNKNTGLLDVKIEIIK